MKKFVSYEKASAKEKKKLNSIKRRLWTRSPAEKTERNRKAYYRAESVRAARKEKDDI